MYRSNVTTKKPDDLARYVAFRFRNFQAEKNLSWNELERATGIKKNQIKTLIEKDGRLGFGLLAQNRAAALFFGDDITAMKAAAREWLKTAPPRMSRVPLLEDYLDAHFKDPRVRTAVLAKPLEWAPQIVIHADQMARREEYKNLPGEKLLNIARDVFTNSRIAPDDTPFGLDDPKPLPPKKPKKK